MKIVSSLFFLGGPSLRGKLSLQSLGLLFSNVLGSALPGRVEEKSLVVLGLR